MPKLFLFTIEVYYLLCFSPTLQSYLIVPHFFTGLILFLALGRVKEVLVVLHFVLLN
jgi:hypothetical protein